MLQGHGLGAGNGLCGVLGVLLKFIVCRRVVLAFDLDYT